MKKINLVDNTLLDTTFKIILFFGIFLYPVYLFDSGSIQISHYLLFIFSFIVLVINRILLDKYFFTFLFFLAYCLIVTVFYLYYDLTELSDIKLHTNKSSTIKYLKELLFLSYNFILTISLLSFLNYQKKFNLIFYGVVCANLIILITMLYKFTTGGLEFRFPALFNNPNQLGYYCICSFSLIYLFYRNQYIPYYLMIMSLLIIIFSMLTLSKASYVALFLCLILE